MKTRKLASKHNCIMALTALVLFPGVLLHAQMAVHDAPAQAAKTAQHTEILGKWAKDVENFNQQFAKIQEHVQVAQDTLKVIGDPAQALQKLGSMGVLPATDGLSSSFELAENLQKTVDIGQSLQGTGDGFYKSIGSSVQLPDGSSFTRNTQLYKSFAGFEQEKQQHDKVIEDIRAKRSKIMTQIDTLNNQQFTDQSQAQLASVRLQALTAQLNALNGEEQTANNQRQARAEANDNDREKQREADAEERKEIEKKAGKKARGEAEGYL